VSPAADFQKAWTRFTFGQKLSIIGIFVVLFAGIAALPFLLRSSNYALLYSDLDEQEAGKIVAKLKESNIIYRLSNGGKAIYVPDEKVHEMRLQMAMQGLPANSVGFELFDKTNFGMTDFVQHLNYQRAIQGELSRTISQLECVEQARVHIVLPSESVFVENEKEPTASVVLKLRAGNTMNKRQINGVVHLVASSVEGLKPNNITIVSSQGEVLYVGSDSSSAGSLTGSQFEITQGVEKYFEGKIQSMMDSVLGPNKAIVRVSLNLNFDQINTEKEAFDPETVLRSEQNSKSESTGEGENGSTSKEETVNNFEVSKTIQRVVSAVGDIRRMTIAVVVDGTYKTETEGEPPIYAPRTEEELQKYEDLVKQSVNFNEERGDKIRIQNIPFDMTYKDEMKKELAESEKQVAGKERMRMIMGIGQKALKVMIVILVIFFALKTLKNMKPQVVQSNVSGNIPSSESMAAAMPSTPMQAQAAAAAYGPPPVIQPPAAGNDQKAKEIAENIKKKWG
jgi:flagellar M-ring protein FliF